jgi:hypothetical protein
MNSKSSVIDSNWLEFIKWVKDQKEYTTYEKIKVVSEMEGFYIDKDSDAVESWWFRPEASEKNFWNWYIDNKLDQT